MSFWNWLAAMIHPKLPPDPVKEKLTRRQIELADRLAVLTGKTRDQVLSEAYRTVHRHE